MVEKGQVMGSTKIFIFSLYRNVHGLGLDLGLGLVGTCLVRDISATEKGVVDKNRGDLAD